VRPSGADTFVTVNIHLNKDLSCLEAHSTCDLIESEIMEKVTRCHVLIHVEPDEAREIIAAPLLQT
jgi:divalent metal cation (Fe/Co/Zn/Cd) transporter